MSRIYTARFDGVSVAAAQDLLSLVMAATDTGLIHEIGFSNLSEVGDVEEEMLLIQHLSGQTTVGSGGSTPAMVPRMFGDAASGATVRANDTTEASSGTIVTHYSWNWNIRIPFQMIWTPETRPVISPSRRTTFALITVPGSTITMAGYIVYEELG